MKTLVEIMNGSETAEAAFVFLALRERFRGEPMRIARFSKSLKEAGATVNRDDLNRMFKELEEYGAGKVIISRTQPYQFIWSKNYIELASQAVEGQKTTRAPIAKRVQPAKAESQETVFVMPSGLVVRLKLNKNAKESDIADLANKLQNLTA